MNAGNYDVAIDFSNLFMDDPSLGLAKYLSVDRAPENRSRSKDAELDKLYDAASARARRREAQGDDPRVREARCSSRPTSSRCCGGTASCRATRRVMGWKMSPSHNLGADLAEVWLNQ